MHNKKKYQKITVFVSESLTHDLKERKAKKDCFTTNSIWLKIINPLALKIPVNFLHKHEIYYW